jgi:signal transduction histidine kinase
LAGRALKPLALIAVEANSISALNLERRVKVPATRDEIALLAAAFNRLLDRLQAAFTELREFTGNASHELRTPLAALHSIGELALTVDQTPTQYRETISHMLEEAHRLTQLVESLLMLARADADLATVRTGTTTVALVEVVDTVCTHLRPLAEERNQRLSFHGAVTLQSRIDGELLELALVNIVHNAIKFTPDGGRIDVRVDESESIVTIVVEDSGPGIRASEEERVFERFYRSGQERSSTNGGFGLGLAIARASIARLGGSVSAARSAAGGARIIIAIPLSRQSTTATA